MVTVFETSWTASCRAAFLAQRGIAIVYQPGVLDRAITAIVKYVTDDATVAPVLHHRGPLVHIKVANDATLGIAASEYADNQTVSVPPRPLASAKVMHLARIVKADGIWMTYECH